MFDILFMTTSLPLNTVLALVGSPFPVFLFDLDPVFLTLFILGGGGGGGN